MQVNSNLPRQAQKGTETRVRGERTRVLALFLASRGLGVGEDNL